MRRHVTLRLLFPTLVAAVTTCHAAVAVAQQGGPQPAPSEQSTTLVYAARGAPAKNLANSLEPLASRDGLSIIVEPVTNHLVISGASAAVRELTNVLEQIDRSPARIEAQLLIVELAVADLKFVDGDFEEYVAAINKLQQEGAVTVLNRIRLTTLDNQQAQVQVGRQLPVVTGERVDRSGRFAQGSVRRAATYQMDQEGIVVAVTPRAASDGTILLQLNIEESRIDAPPTPSADDAESESIVPPTKVTATTITTTSVKNGEAVFISDVDQRRADADRRIVVVVTARTLSD